MKIGLLTVYSFNYGSYFQAVALQKQIEALGHDCELINEQFKRNEWKNLQLLYSFDEKVPSIFKPLISKIFPQYCFFATFAV